MRQSNRDHIGALSLIALGALLGPSGLGVLTAQLLELVDPAIPVALAALGVLAGLELRAPERVRSRGTAAVALGLVAAIVVAGSMMVLALAMGVRGAPLLAVAVVPGVCAFAASTRNDILPVLLGAVLLVFMHTSAGVAAWTTSAATAVAIGCAVAGWLLLRQASPMNPQHGVTIALLLLIGGAADYVLVPALLAGLAAGLCWRLLGGAVQESVQRDIAYLRQPVVAILLLTAGTHVELSIESVVLAGAYAIVVAALARVGEAVTSVTLTGSNILAVALAVSALRLSGNDMALPFAAVILGTLLWQLLALSTGRRQAFE
jgi:hypothetical protein